MIHPDTELRFISEAIGYGVVATRLIPKGTIVWCLDELDQVISRRQADSMAPPYRDILERYAFRDKDGNYVLCWDNSRFVNHSFRPNSLPTPYDMELAVRDIQPGEEILDHYGSLNLEAPFRALPEPGTRRRVAYPHDLLRHHRSWDKQLRDAFQVFTSVPQPLLPMLAKRHRLALDNILEQKADIGSCLETYCPPPEVAELRRMPVGQRSS